MKVLWVSNTIFPDLAKELNLSTPVSGGWMFGLAKDLVNNDIELSVVTAKSNFEKVHKSINGIEYFVISGKKHIALYDEELEYQWQRIIDQIKPDIVHIHGMEYAHGLSLVKTFPDLNYVASIQGILHECYKYYTGQIEKKEILKHITLRDIIRRDSILNAKKNYLKRSIQVENEYFARISHIMGRSQWDWDYAKSINKNCVYHRCNDSLRDAFYLAPKWNLERKNNYTLFLSQASYPLKGLHKVLEALPAIIEDFPQTKIRVAGVNILRTNSLKDLLRQNGYANFLSSLIRKFKLQNHLEFTGILDEDGMVKEYLNCHIFLSPTSIDNCSNSVGEAQLLGVPCIASYVGGVPDMIEQGESGFLYRFEATEMLSQRIRNIFDDDNLALKLSNGAIEIATKRHDRETNMETTIQMYQNILNTN